VRFLEVWYQRDDHQEVTVIFLPDLSEIAPTLEQAIAQWQQKQAEAAVNEPEKVVKAEKTEKPENTEMTDAEKEEKARKEEEEKESPLEPPKDEIEEEQEDDEDDNDDDEEEDDQQPDDPDDDRLDRGSPHADYGGATTRMPLMPDGRGVETEGEDESD